MPLDRSAVPVLAPHFVIGMMWSLVGVRRAREWGGGKNDGMVLGEWRGSGGVVGWVIMMRCLREVVGCRRWGRRGKVEMWACGWACIDISHR